jgi:uncharacterized repeat protein (TIGR03803 family)
MVRLIVYNVGRLLLCCSALMLGMAVANAQLQLQRLYTAPNTSVRPAFLLQGDDGNFYGTFAANVFKLTPAGALTILPTPLLYEVNRELALGDDGSLYGTVNSQPQFGGNTNGLIFRITPSGQYSVEFAFNGQNGALPVGMRKGTDGCFYGLMVNSNHILPSFITNYTSIFQFTTNQTVTILYSAANAPEFTGLPVQGPDGNLYGTMFSRSVQIQPPFGTLYRFSIYRLSTNGNLQTIYTRSNAPGSASDLIFGPDGSLYGTIGSDFRPFLPGPSYGSIFRLTTNGVFSSLFSFNGTNGSDPEERLVVGNDGYLYGSTFSGGISNRGTVFQISLHGDFKSLFDFADSTASNPSAPLVDGADGNLYGITGSSTKTNIATIFRLVQPTTISNFGISNDTATLTWNSFSNAVYRVEYKSALSDSSWIPLIQSVTATDQTITIVETQATDPQRLYRVVLLP